MKFRPRRSRSIYRSEARRRAFALPMVVLLSLVGSIAVTFLLSASTSSSLTVRRQLDRYADHHAARGLQEVLSQWLAGVTVDNIDQFVSPEGLAFDLEFEGDSRVRIFLSDGQGTARLNPSRTGLVTLDDLGPRVIETLEDIVSPNELEKFTRPVGPVTISAKSAPPEVLDAVLGTVVPGPAARSIAREFLSARDRGLFRRMEFTTIIDKAGLDDEARATLYTVLTVDPEIWMVRIEIEHKGENVDTIYALTHIHRGRGSSLEPNNQLLTWDRVSARR